MPIKIEAPIARTIEASCQVNPSKGINDMNIVAKNELTFQSVSMAVVNIGGSVWLSSGDLAKALGYKSQKSITNLYNSNADEFSPQMTQVIDSVTSGNYKKKQRVFSLRGAHLIAMFARTSVAKLFRKWVLDILDKEVEKVELVKPVTQREKDAHNINALAKHYDVFYKAWKESIYPMLRKMESPLAGNLVDRFQDGYAFTMILKRELNGRLSNGEVPRLF